MADISVCPYCFTENEWPFSETIQCRSCKKIYRPGINDRPHCDVPSTQQISEYGCVCGFRDVVTKECLGDFDECRARKEVV